MIPRPTDYRRARELALLMGGNGKSTNDSVALMAEKLAEYRREDEAPQDVPRWFR